MIIHGIEIKEIIRSKRRTIGFVINKNAELILRVPAKISNDHIANAIISKRDWINKQKDLMLNKIEAPKLYVKGEKFYYRGKTYPLNITSNNTYAINFDGNEFILDEELVTRGKQVFEIWYKRQANRIIIPRAYELAEKFGFKPKIFKLSNAGKRWGSCSSQASINLNWKLIMTEPSATEYVIIHELAHLKHLDHSRNFWFLVERMMPDYEIWVNYLKQNARKFEL